MSRVACVVLSLFILVVSPAAIKAASDWSPLLEAAFHGDLAQLETLLDGGAEVDATDGEGSTSLMVAASRGHSAIVRELLSRGARIDARNKYGWTPLMLATKAGHQGIVRTLLARGADPNIKNRDSTSALMMAQGSGMADLFKAERDQGRSEPTPEATVEVTPRPGPDAEIDKEQAARDRQRAAAELARREQQDRQRNVTRLLATAQRQVGANRLTLPAGDNAYATYTEVLDLDPGNQEAEAGLERIADQYVRLAERSGRDGDWNRSLEYIERGLRVRPKHAQLLALKEDIQARQALAKQERQEAEAQRQQVANLLATAKRQLRAGQLTGPDGNNAHASYRGVLALDPGNREAEAGLKQIAEYYATAARKQGEAGAWQDSLAQSETGLGVLPGHSGLLALRDRAQAALAEVGRHERRRQAVADLLAEAERQLQAGQLMQPEGDNAHASLLKVLALEPENAAAAAGLARIADHYMQEARRQGEAGAWQNSLELSERGLEVVPDHPELLALREQAQAGLTELEARRQEVQRRQQQVLDLLATAERQLKAGRLTVPETDNAHATYLQVLKLDPDNEEAQTGLKWMAERYAQWAWERGEAGEWQESLDQIERGLQVNPGHAGLLALQQQARLALEAAERERQEAEKRRQQVAELLALAAQQMDLNRLTEPSEANAHETYREVLNLNPDNPEAKRGLAEIVQRYTQWAQEQREAGAWQETLDLSDRGLRVAPDDDELLALREQARKALAEAEKRRREVAALLAEARRQLRAGQLAEPEGDNAHATYRKVLKLEPENSEAKQELIEIAERYADWAQEQAEAGAWEKSLAHSERGLTVSPGYPRLMALRDRAQTALAEAERKRQEAERRHRRVVDLLAVAQQQLQAGRLTEPEGDNALSSFTEVLALESDNREAQAGLVQIAKLIAGQARDLAEAGQWRESLARSEQGLKAFPDNGELMAQRQQAQAALDEAERRRQESLRRQQEVAKLLASARQQLALGHLVEPVNENAHASYLRVLELDPGNREAEGGVEEIATIFAGEAQAQAEAGAWRESLTQTEKGLAVLPGHADLLALREKAQVALAEAERQRREAEKKAEAIRTLLATAERQLAAGRLTEPEGDNTLDSYRQVLVLDPDNAQAKAGLEQLLTQAEQAAEEENDALRQVEQELDIEEQLMRLTIQRLLTREWGRRPQGAAQ